MCLYTALANDRSTWSTIYCSPSHAAQIGLPPFLLDLDHEQKGRDDEAHASNNLWGPVEHVCDSCRGVVREPRDGVRQARPSARQSKQRRAQGRGNRALTWSTPKRSSPRPSVLRKRGTRARASRPCHCTPPPMRPVSVCWTSRLGQTGQRRVLTSSGTLPAGGRCRRRLSGPSPHPRYSSRVMPPRAPFASHVPRARALPGRTARRGPC